MWVLSSLLRRGPGKERKRERAGHDGKGKREERLPRFPSSHPSPRGFYFSIIAIFIGTVGAYADHRVDFIIITKSKIKR